MAWGYAKGFVIEYTGTKGKGKSCRTCKNYAASDRSCKVSAVYPPEDGYDSWKRCGLYNKTVTSGKETSDDISQKDDEKGHNKKTRKKAKKNNKNPIRIIGEKDCHDFSLRLCANYAELDKHKETVFLEIVTEDGKRKKINAFLIGDEIYISTKALDPNRLETILRMFE